MATVMVTYSHPLCSMSISPHILRYSYPWSKPCVWSKVKVTFDLENSMVKVMVNVKPIGHILGLEFNWYVCFSFRRNRSTVGRDIANSIFDLEIQGQRHGQGQTWWSHLSPEFQSIYLFFISWQSDHFWMRYSKCHIWPWKFKVKVMAKVKPNGHIWSLEFIRYVCFSFHGNQIIFGWDIANSIFDLEKFKAKVMTKIYQNLIR